MNGAEQRQMRVQWFEDEEMMAGWRPSASSLLSQLALAPFYL